MILPCPFCGCRPEHDKSLRHIGKGIIHQLSCCIVATGYQDTLETAKIIWNRRHAKTRVYSENSGGIAGDGK